MKKLLPLLSVCMLSWSGATLAANGSEEFPRNSAFDEVIAGTNDTTEKVEMGFGGTHVLGLIESSKVKSKFHKLSDMGRISVAVQKVEVNYKGEIKPAHRFTFEAWVPYHWTSRRLVGSFVVDEVRLPAIPDLPVRYDYIVSDITKPDHDGL